MALLLVWHSIDEHLAFQCHQMKIFKMDIEKEEASYSLVCFFSYSLSVDL